MKRFSLIFLLLIASKTFANPIELEVNLEGLPRTIDEQVKSHLRIVQAMGEHKLNRTRAYNLHYLTKEQIKSALQGLGYYNSQIDANITENGSKITTDYKIKLGPPVIINKIDFGLVGQANKDSQLKNISPNLKANDQLNHKQYEDAKKELLSQLIAHGFIEAQFSTSEILVNIDKNTAEIILQLNSGPQYNFGKISFENDDYDHEMLARYLSIHRGDTYSESKVSALRNSLNRSDLFEKVRVKTVSSENEERELDLVITSESKPVNHYTGKIGYYTDTGPSGSLNWHRRIKPEGHHLNLGMTASYILQDINASYRIPGKYAATDYLEIGSFYRREKFDSRYSNSVNLEVTKSIKRNRTRTNWGLKYHNELFRQENDTKRLSHLLIPKVKVTWTDKRNQGYRVFGKQLVFSAQGSHRTLLSSTDFAKFQLSGFWNRALTEHFSLLLRGNIGTIAAHDFDNKFPLSMRWFTGGARTIRGFRYRSLGHKVINGNRLTNRGGRHLVVASAELERQVWEEFGVAAFFDAGNAVRHWNESIARSAGVGLRYNTSIGPVRLDLAKPLSDHGKRKWRIHFTFGWDF